MLQKIKVNIAGKEYLVEVGDLNADPIEVLVNGKKVFVENLQVGGKVVKKGGGENADPAVFSNQFEIKGGMEVSSLVAPIPGDVVDILVRPGDQVAVGDVICSIDAMKMKNAIRSPRNGEIMSVEVVVGQTVNYGDTLILYM